MAEPFQSDPSRSSGVLARFKSRMPRAAAAQELESALAEAERVRDVTFETLREVGERHGIDLSVRLRALRRNLYRRFFEHCLMDYALSDEELRDMQHLREVLHLEDHDIADIQDGVSREVYGAAVEQALEDDLLDDEEVQFLKSLRKDLDLSELHAQRMIEEEQRRAQQRLLSRSAVQSSFLAPDGVLVQLDGTSPDGLEQAIRNAVDRASQALPSLAWAEVSKVRIETRSGQVVNWSVQLDAGVERRSATSDGDED